MGAMFALVFFSDLGLSDNGSSAKTFSLFQPGALRAKSYSPPVITRRTYYYGANCEEEKQG